MNDKVWKSAELGKKYLEGVRGGIPLAAAQLDVLATVIRSIGPEIDSFLDLGCGDGVLGKVIQTMYPGAEGTFLDFSEFMIESARSKALPGSPSRFILGDYGTTGWQSSLGRTSFDAVVSGFSIHHQPDERKVELYGEILDLLVPGGIFLNLEHVSSPTPRIEKAYEEFFLLSMEAHQTSTGATRSKEELRQEYLDRPDRAANILAPVEDQCAWLRRIGYEEVDCFFKVFELALFGGLKPR